MQLEVINSIKCDSLSFPLSEKNENVKSVNPLSRLKRQYLIKEEVLDYYDTGLYNIKYISDIHLMHKMINAKCESETDIKNALLKIAKKIPYNSKTVLINGDTSSSFNLFCAFLDTLYQKSYMSYTDFIFTLGNHEYWDFYGHSVSEIEEIYRKQLTNHNMYLLHNNIIYRDIKDRIQVIETKELEGINNLELRNRLRTARIILFGGTGFSGYNNHFNANQGIYRNTITRNEEIKQSLLFENLYKKVSESLKGMNVIIMTHMPMSDWNHSASSTQNSNSSGESFYSFLSSCHPGFVYLSGHNHRNFYYDDGDIRLFADNQFGYKKGQPNVWPHMKSFLINRSTDYFSDFKDGIHEISADDYKKFVELKNIYIDFNRPVNELYMLKKGEYYCFIHRSKNKTLSILNGGARKHLMKKDIQFYYDNMDIVIKQYSGPLEKYTSFQKKISNEIKKIGGSGIIHGCIVDIDWFNHIYVNPIDGKVTGYWASDIINKIVYPSIPSLLESNCPILFKKYTSLIDSGKQDEIHSLSGINPINKELIVFPTSYLNTDIYSMSRELKKIQKLESKILTKWPEDINTDSMIEGY